MKDGLYSKVIDDVTKNSWNVCKVVKRVFVKIVGKVTNKLSRNEEKDEKYTYQVVQESINKICGNDPIKLKQLYVEALCYSDSRHKTPLTISVASFGMSIFSLMVSIRDIDRSLNILVIVPMCIIFFIIIVICRPTNGDKYNNYIIHIIKDTYNSRRRQRSVTR